MQKRVVLKEGRDLPIRNFHPWIFSGAIDFFPECDPGELLPVFSQKMQLLGWGYFNSQCSLTGRMVSFGDKDPYLAIKESLLHAIDLRRKLFDPTKTNSFRLVHGEGDFLPGLVVDRYGSFLVMQISTYGMERLKEYLLSLLRTFHPELEGIYEKSDLSVRNLEGLERREGLIWGQVPSEVEILENHIRYLVEIPKGQKTGFFLDQREMRRLVQELADGKKVLNAFSYTGGFSVAAALGKALRVDSVEISEKALLLAKTNFSLNKISLEHHHFYCEDVFSFLRERTLNYDLMILDPPAFAKKREDLPAAIQGYRELHRLALKKLPLQSFLLTSSCSYYISEETFRSILFQVAREVGRKVTLLSSHRQAYDHPISLFHKEGSYLKSFFIALGEFF